jgi:hypothetical protein
MSIIKFSNIFKLKNLRNIAKIYKIKFVSKLNKTTLINLLNNHNAVKIIQRNFRNKLFLSKECPICNEILIYPFVSFKINDKFFYYDFKTIVTYFSKTGDFRDPCTRQLIPDSKICKINDLINYYYGNRSNKILISKNMVKSAEFNIITYCIYDLIKELESVETLSLKDTYENILPRFVYYINYLIKRYPVEEISIVLKACKASVKNATLLEYLKLVEIKIAENIDI